jgi:3-hydroxybutyryl-CoA dehydrogenase
MIHQIDLTVGIVGGGQMGGGIAEVCAVAGAHVTLVEVSPQRADAARAQLERRAQPAADSPGALSASALGRISFACDLDSLSGSEIAIEAVPEERLAKAELLARLDALLPNARFLASTTSSIPIAGLASATARPDRVIGVHFFNPVPVMKLVELIPALQTSPRTISAAREFVDGLGKDSIECEDKAGFVVNALLVPFILDAVRMFESRQGSREDIDRGMRLGCGHPMGPLELADFVGLDTIHQVARSLHQEFGTEASVPPPLLSRMVDAGRLGRKSGRGFYEYDAAELRAESA